MLEDVLISSEDIPGWSVASEGNVTVALDITLTEALKKEGIARDFVNRIQNLRKDMGLEVLDKIAIEVQQSTPETDKAISEFADYIRTETQAFTLELKQNVSNSVEVEMEDFNLNVKVTRK